MDNLETLDCRVAQIEFPGPDKPSVAVVSYLVFLAGRESAQIEVRLEIDEPETTPLKEVQRRTLEKSARLLLRIGQHLK